MIILIKASLILCILWVFYKLVLEKESFFSANRAYLFSCVFFAATIPFISLPQLSEHQGIVEKFIEVPISEQNISNHTLDNTKNETTSLESIVTEKTKTTNPIDQQLGKSDPIERAVDNETTLINTDNKSEFYSFSILDWILYIYLFGILILSMNFIGQILSVVRKIWSTSDQIRSDEGIIVNLDKDTEPCSFFNYIFINPSKYDYDTYEQILNHEKIHVSKWHSIDLIFSELSVIFMWFNPFVWLLRKEVEKNIEYQTDDLLIAQNETEKESYQLNLVKIACNTHPLAVTTNYNQSLIKNRILKMNSKRSNPFSYWKYSFILPLLLVITILLNKPTSLVASEKSNIQPIENFDHFLDSDTINQTITIADETDIVDNQIVSNSYSVIEDKPIKESTISPIIDNSPSEKIVPIADELSIIPTIQDKVILDEKQLADCDAFEKAVKEGDLERVKEILKTLHPDCLKLKKQKESNGSSLRKMIKNKKAQLTKNDKKQNSGLTACIHLRESLEKRDYQELLRILTYDDINCLSDIYGDPTDHIPLLQEILLNGGGMAIGKDGVITISANAYYIDINPHDGPECNDPNFLRLVSAIKNKDESEVRNILRNEYLTCPLNSDTQTNDFPFIKTLMQHSPEVLFSGNHGVTIHGLAVLIDIDEKVNIPSYSDAEDSYTSDYNKQTMAEIEKMLLEGDENALKNANCLNLMEAIELNENNLVKKMLDVIEPDCYHRKTHTHSNDRGSSTSSIVYTPLIIAIYQENIELVELLINNGADIKYTGDGYKTPTMRAAQKGNIEIIKILIKYGADINETDNSNRTPLDYALANDKEKMIKFLRSKGAKSSFD